MMEDIGTLEFLNDELYVCLDIWTAAWLGECLTLKSYLASDQIKNHPDDSNNPDIRNKGGWTPLLYACHVGHYNVITSLLTAGADPNLSSLGVSPLILASSSGATDSIPLLINAGANINAVDKSKNTPLHHSAMSGHHQTIQLLLKSGSNIHAVNNVGNSALMEAVSHGHEIAVTSLLREGADPRVANNKKRSSLEIARLYGFERIADLIITSINGRLLQSGNHSTQVVNLTESIPSIHTGPAEFKRMISPATQPPSQSEFTDELFEQKMQELRIKSSRKKITSSMSSQIQPPQRQMSKKSTEYAFKYIGPNSLTEALGSIGMSKYEHLFITQDIDLHVFLTLNDQDLKEIGVKLFGPRRKMTTCISRINENVKHAVNPIERSYADRLAVQVSQLGDQNTLAEQKTSDLHQLLKQEKQLRYIAEQCAQDAQFQSDQLKKLLLSILRELNDLTMSNDLHNMADHLTALTRNIQRAIEAPKP